MAAAPPELLRLYPDALRDSYAAAYSLLVVAPLTALASRLLLYRGKKTTSLQIYLVSFAVPMLAVWLPTWIWPEKRNVYEFLTTGKRWTRRMIDKARYLYDFWGPGQNMSFHETIFNVGLFYLLWVAIISCAWSFRSS
uniref:Uncharacterized protein n=1 Tax=Hyaloperonospora arabidopsidis (strain Emoy2) TaxID=559515 RepID=M4BPS7_HYAAE